MRGKLFILSFCLGLTMLLPVIAEDIDLRVPHRFTSPDGGATRCFDAAHCYGPPEGGDYGDYGFGDYGDSLLNACGHKISLNILDPAAALLPQTIARLFDA